MAQQICKRSNLKHRVDRRVMILQRLVRKLLNNVRACSAGKPGQYRMLLPYSGVISSPELVMVTNVNSNPELDTVMPRVSQDLPADLDLVSLKMGLLGDHKIGKTSFLVKYVGDEKQKVHCSEMMEGIHTMDKVQFVRGARISYSIWEIEGDDRSCHDRIPTICKDSVAILFMFDLTCRSTLNSVIAWYKEARKWNSTSIPIIVGTKFDEFIQLPLDLQWTIASQARAFAKAINATVFFSSATYNINVNKIFKFITAKLFDLPWTVERNLTIGEPIIDF